VSSASRPSEAAVNPTRSANNTETSRRSAWGDAALAGVDVAGATSAVPHSPQNFTPGALGDPQFAHATASGVPHSPQNFLPASFA